MGACSGQRGRHGCSFAKWAMSACTRHSSAGTHVRSVRSCIMACGRSSASHQCRGTHQYSAKVLCNANARQDSKSSRIHRKESHVVWASPHRANREKSSRPLGAHRPCDVFGAALAGCSMCPVAREAVTVCP